MALPTHIHFFSYETKVSLELPSDWQVESEAEGVVTYILEGPESITPHFIVKTIGLPYSKPSAYQELAQTLLSLPRTDFVLLSHVLNEVDNQPAVTDVFTYSELEVEARLLHYQVVVQVERVMFSITGIGLEAQAQELLPLFAAAVESVRFVPAS